MNVMTFSRLILVAAVTVTFAASQPLHAAPRENVQDPAARLLRDASLMLLKEGNARYETGRPQHPHLDAERRSNTVTQGQEPFATVLACSDSREPVELIFDRGVGDLFVVRVAGNIAGTSELASVEYGVGHLNTPLLVVMGHTKCGAVTAVVKGTELHGHLAILAEKIKPAASKAKEESQDSEEVVAKAIQANVWQTVEDIIRQSSVVREKLKAERLNIFGAIYDLEQGKVHWLGAHPAQEALVALAEQAQTDATLARNSSSSEKAPAPSPAGSSASTSRRPPGSAPPGSNVAQHEIPEEPSPPAHGKNH